MFERRKTSTAVAFVPPFSSIDPKRKKNISILDTNNRNNSIKRVSRRQRDNNCFSVFRPRYRGPLSPKMIPNTSCQPSSKDRTSEISSAWWSDPFEFRFKRKPWRPQSNSRRSEIAPPCLLVKSSKKILSVFQSKCLRRERLRVRLCSIKYENGIIIIFFLG